MSVTAKWQPWWPLLATVFVTAIALPGSGVLNGTPPGIVIAVGVAVVAVMWGFIEMLAQQWRKDAGKPLVVYPAHQAAAGPRVWLLTTPNAYRWLGGWLALTALPFATSTWLNDVVLTGVLGALALVTLLMWLVVWLAASVVVGAIVYVRRALLGPLCLVVFGVLLAFSARLHVMPPAEYALVYGVGLAVVAGAVWWCRRHPRSIDPRTENRSAP